MSATPVLRAPRWTPARAASLLWPAGVAVVGLVFAKLITQPTTFRLGLGAAMIALAVGLASKSPRGMLYCLIVWLAALGLVRRVTTGVSAAGEFDVLLAVGGIAVAALAVAAGERQAFRHPTALSRAVLALCVLVFLEAFNPLQGSLMAGLSGLLFLLVPLLGFWAGRALCDDRTLAGILKLVAALAVAAAAYGHFQTFRGFPTWDEAWIRNSGYTALNVGGVIRPFGTFASASEYVTFLAVGFVVWLSFGRRLSRLPTTVAVLAVLGAAVFLVSTRGAIFVLAAALGLMAAARFRFSLWQAGFAVVALVVALPTVVGWFAPQSYGSSPQSALIAHQLDGLRDPFDEESSTLGEHLSMFNEGLSQALSHPLGQGIGKVTIAGAKFGGESANTEADPSNVAVSMGVAGVIAYGVVVAVGLRRGFQRARDRRDALSLAALGVLVVTFLQWLNGGQYAVALLPWLVLGWLDRPAPAPASD